MLLSTGAESAPRRNRESPIAANVSAPEAGSAHASPVMGGPGYAMTPGYVDRICVTDGGFRQGMPY